MAGRNSRIGAGAVVLAFGIFTAASFGGEGSPAWDLTVGAIQGVSKWGAATSEEGATVMAYSFGSVSCNMGDAPLAWDILSDRHAVFVQNVYRVKDGRIEQIGMSWVLHAYCALSTSYCTTCAPAGAGCVLLGVGCADVTSASLAGQPNFLGRRSEVNAATGDLVVPMSNPPIPPVIGRRVQIHGDDLAPGLNPGARYFAEIEAVHAQDAADGHAHNNASHREFMVGPLTSGSYELTMSGVLVPYEPAINAWQQVHPDVSLQTVDVAGDGRFHVGHRVIDNGDGTWRYEYAIFNLSSDRSGASFTVPIPAGVTVTEVGFSDIDHHSNEVYDGTDWTATVGGGAVTWAATQTFEENPHGNALRWGTLYGFRFTADRGPHEASATLGLFKPGTPASVSVDVAAPAGPVFAPADVNEDGVVNGRDLAMVLGSWGPGPGCDADINGDNVVDGGDLAILLGGWAP